MRSRNKTAGSRRSQPRHLRNSIASCRGHGRGETRSTFSGDASPERSTAARSRRFFAEPETDAILVMNCPTAVADSLGAATPIVESLPAERSVPVLTAWLGETAALPARRLFAANENFHVRDAGRCGHRLHVSPRLRNQELLLETPRAHAGTDAPDREVAQKLVAEVLAIGRPLLTEPEAKRVLQAYAIPTVDTHTARDPAEAAKIAAEIGGRIAIKILSPDIVHKSDVGGVRLDLSGAEVESAAREMLDKVSRRAPQARLIGFSIEEVDDQAAAGLRASRRHRRRPRLRPRAILCRARRPVKRCSFLPISKG